MQQHRRPKTGTAKIPATNAGDGRSSQLFGARRMPPMVLRLLALVVALALFVPLTQTGSVWLMLGVLFVIGPTLYGPDSMISGAAAVDFGTRKGAGTATGFI